MSLDQRLCPGVGGRKCGVFMSPIFRNPHPICARCRGKCSSDVTCDICKDWSVAQWEAFLSKRSYSGRRKSCPSGSSLPHAPLPLPSPLPLLQKLGAVCLPSNLPPFLQRGESLRGSREASSGLALVVFPLSPLALGWERRGGGWGSLAPRGKCGWATSFLSVEGEGGGWGVTGPSRSQESTALVRSAPPSVDSSASAERDPSSCSYKAGGSSEGCSRSRSSWASLSRAREFREERRHARSQSAGSHAWSRETRSRSSDHSRSRGRVRSP